MTDEERIVLDEEEYEKLTPKQKKQYVRSLKSHKSLAIDKLNEILKELAYRSENTEIVVQEQDDTKRIQKINRPGNVKNLPKKIEGPKYPQIFDRTGFSKSKD